MEESETVGKRGEVNVPVLLAVWPYSAGLMSVLCGWLAAGKIWVLWQLKQMVMNEENVTELNSEPFGTHLCPEPYRALYFPCMDELSWYLK